MVTITREVTVPVYERQRIVEQTSWGESVTDHSVLVGWRTATVTLTIDSEALFNELAARALKMRGGKATQGSGRIVAKVRKPTITFQPKAEA